MIDADTGNRFPTVQVGANVAYSPALLDGLAIVDNGDGYLFAIKK
jgi:hypothetical protein